MPAAFFLYGFCNRGMFRNKCAELFRALLQLLLLQQHDPPRKGDKIHIFTFNKKLKIAVRNRFLTAAANAHAGIGKYHAGRTVCLISSRKKLPRSLFKRIFFLSAAAEYIAYLMEETNY